MVIFKGKRCKPEWLDNAPSSAMVRMSERGWVTTEIFMEWGRRFISQLPTGMPHLPLLDGHSSHLYNLEFLHMMRENRVGVWCLPPHSTHVLQPADVSLFRILKHNWNENGLARGRENGAKKLARAEFFTVFTPAYEAAATAQNTQSGFRKTGICPLNPNALSNTDFAPSLTTDIALPTAPQPGSCEPVQDVIFSIPDMDTLPPGTEVVVEICGS